MTQSTLPGAGNSIIAVPVDGSVELAAEVTYEHFILLIPPTDDDGNFLFPPKLVPKASGQLGPVLDIAGFGEIGSGYQVFEDGDELVLALDRQPLFAMPADALLARERMCFWARTLNKLAFCTSAEVLVERADELSWNGLFG